MSGDGGSGNVPPFPPGYRASGVLLHVTSLPSPYGIGDLGAAAFSWIFTLRASDGGRCCRSVLRVTEILLISRCPRSRAILR